MKYNFFQNKKALFLLMIAGLLSMGQAQAAACNDIVAGRFYTCNFALNSGTIQTSFEFSGSGSFARFAGGAFSLGCTCETKGKPKNPKFEIGKNFQCVGAAGGASAVAFVGKASKKGNKIKKAIIAVNNGITGVFECLEGVVAPPLGSVSDSTGSPEGLLVAE